MDRKQIIPANNNELRPFWRRFFAYNWKFGLFLVLIVCIPRFMFVLHANASGNYSLIGLIMTVSAVIPFIFLSRQGQKEAGISKPVKHSWLFLSVIAGLTVSIALCLFGEILYGNSYENWYQYIGKSYNIPPGMSVGDKALLFGIMAFTGMTFSPIGEELFFRGIVHASFEKSVGERKASAIDSSAFALTHISHFGWVLIDNEWKFFTIPAIIWVTSMFLVSRMFFAFRKRSGSILGAIICHSAFNLGMIYCIFYLI